MKLLFSALHLRERQYH